ncbi:hypothetical protein DL96DRAFT_1684985 [Flagelloscypha sp. PMI_526]|nr:hypothetical protein DL96DRAFT_1684985 [Flagelloscypha sp. PMI_526]
MVTDDRGLRREDNDALGQGPPLIEHPPSRMKASHNLPLDILRLLLEFSASAWLESAKALSLVSREVQGWTDPHFFQIVEGSFLFGEYRISLLDRMCMSDASPRLVLARNYVRAAAWRNFVPQQSYIKQALDHFPNLVQLCLWNNVFPFEPKNGSWSSLQPFEITQKYPSLRRVATCLNDLLNVPQNAFGSPFWTTVTHLHLTYSHAISSRHSPFELPLFVTMPSLTHIALSTILGGRNERNVDLAFSRVTATLPPSLKLCLLYITPPQNEPRRPWLARMVITSHEFDERIVMWSMTPEDNTDELVGTSVDDNFRAWCGAQLEDGAHTYWEMGEAVLKKRQERPKTV